VFAPRRRRVALVLEDRQVEIELEREPGPDGAFSAFVPGVRAGARYRYALDDDATFYPDPASRFQPDGPHGPSVVVDPAAFRWSDAGWRGPALRGQVLYELHVGTFTPEGTWAAAAAELPALAELGVTTLEVMPVAEFTGRFGWGYDGVLLYAPSHLYGGPDDMRAFVDRAHALGLAVILDVVYNHLGPDGNYLGAFTDAWISRRHASDWGDALNFDDDGAAPMRDLFAGNAGYWIAEYHLDGLRLDATDTIQDASPEHLLAAVGRRVRAAAGARRTFVVAENEEQDVRLLTPREAGGHGLDAVWSDDFHHAARVAATGFTEAFYADFTGSPQELVAACKWGWLFQGQREPWRQRRRGTPAYGVEPARFVTYLQNHDQVANAGTGARLHQLTSPGRTRALTALLLLGPGTPLLFQGQEHMASSPWTFFADMPELLARLVREGRARFMAKFPSLATPAAQAALPDPGDPATFAACKLDPAERRRGGPALALHRDLLRLRREEPAFASQRAGGVDGAALGPAAFVLRFFGERRGEADDRLLLVNLARALVAPPAEPLLAPPVGAAWTLRWSSQDPVYGGGGTPAVETPSGLRLPAESAVVLAPRPRAGDADDG
jgi:maltooligosyltrehalose trehalohydrolase